MTKDEALKMAIELMERFLEHDGISSSDYIDVLEACKEALESQEQDSLIWANAVIDAYKDGYEAHRVESQEQEPVAWTDKHNLFLEFDKEWLCNKAVCKDYEAIPLYTHPAPLWQGLTAKEIASIPLNEYTVQTVERMLKEKNT